MGRTAAYVEFYVIFYSFSEFKSITSTGISSITKLNQNTLLSGSIFCNHVDPFGEKPGSDRGEDHRQESKEDTGEEHRQESKEDAGEEMSL